MTRRALSLPHNFSWTTAGFDWSEDKAEPWTFCGIDQDSLDPCLASNTELV